MGIKNRIFSKILACDIGIYKVISEITFACEIQILQAWVFINFLCAGYEREFDYHTRELKNQIFSENFKNSKVVWKITFARGNQISHAWIFIYFCVKVTSVNFTFTRVKLNIRSSQKISACDYGNYNFGSKKDYLRKISLTRVISIWKIRA